MYTLDCDYYNKSFDSIDELVEEVINDGMDPNVQILRDGRPTGQEVIEFIVY